MKVRILYLTLFIFFLESLSLEALGANKNRSTRSYQFVPAPLNKKYPLIPGAYFQVLRKWKNPSITWFWIHNDEYDAKINTNWAYRHLGGYGLFLLNHSNHFNRNLVYYIKNKGRFLLDPNRMFHIRGIRSNLLLLNKNRSLLKRPKTIVSYTWKRIGLKARRILMRYWSKKQPLIAIHNNRYLSIKRYRHNPKNFLLAEFDNNPTSTFVFVVDKTHYQKLKSCGVNVIYQLRAQKDGSLSDFAIQNHLPYVNVETKIHHQEEQQKILLKIAYALYPKSFKNNPLLMTDPCQRGSL